MAMTNEERKKALKAKIKAAEEAGDTEEVTYLNELYYNMEVHQMTINVYEGGTVIFQTGNPPPLPPYGGG